MKVSVTLSMSLPISIKKDGKYYISNCAVLDVWSQGETQKKAKHNLGEALRLFLFNCYERGTLEKILKECGFTEATGPPPKKKQQQEIVVPLPFVIDSQLAKCRG